MTWKHENDDLPEETTRALRSLGEIQAPPELWHRVVLANEGLASAPAALERRVSAAMLQDSEPALRGSRTGTGVRPAAVLAFPQRLAAAAALLLVAGGGLLLTGSAAPDGQLPTVMGPRDGLRRSVILRRVERVEDLSPAARLFASPGEAGAER